jgi:glycosyltransferase involved in cell wall biosynthesis
VIPKALTYAVVTPARDEADNLSRLAACVLAQRALPARWVVVDHGSVDATGAVAASLTERAPWIEVLSLPRADGPARRIASVEAFNAGLASLEGEPDVVVKLDADLSFDDDYFERLLDAFASDATLGMASGSAYELEGGRWVQRHMTRSSVWGASRAYRLACFRQIAPLEERPGWDGIDELKAKVRGWSTRTLLDLPFRHHRAEGARDGGREAWRTEGVTAHYMGYRPSYLVARALFRARRDRRALGMIGAYVDAARRREPQCEDRAAVAYLRERQRIREIPLRLREALGR